MKKYLNLFIVAIFATVSFALTSCGSDDDEPTTSSSIVGTWESTDYPMGIKQTLQFASNGKYIEVTVDGDEVDVTKGTWKQDGNKVTVIEEEYNIPMEATVVSVSKDKLILDMLWKVTYKKVSDSSIDKYLK